MKRTMNRRSFLEVSSKVLITSLASSYLPILRAQTKNGFDKKMIHIHLGSGAHHLLALDPLILNEIENRKLDPVKRDERDFVALYEDNELKPTSSFILGPAAEPLVKFSQDISIVAGLQGISISHGENARFNVSGDENARDNIIIAEAYSQLRSGILGIGQRYGFDELSKLRVVDLRYMESNKMISENALKLTSLHHPNSSVVQQMIEVQKRLGQFKATKQKLQRDFSIRNESSEFYDLVATMKLGLSNFHCMYLDNGVKFCFCNCWKPL